MLFLTVLSGICWTIVYIESIRIGFKDKTYAMPIFALALNICWEGMYAYIDLSTNAEVAQSWINLVWFLFDTLIVYTYFKYGKKDFAKHTDQKYFLPWSLIIFIMSLILQYAFYVEFGSTGPVYSAFIQNLIMSILYINMLITRGTIKGQNLTIAYFKWIGTLAPTILIGIQANMLAMILGIFCSVFDILYIWLLYHYRGMAISAKQ